MGCRTSKHRIIFSIFAPCTLRKPVARYSSSVSLASDTALSLFSSLFHEQHLAEWDEHWLRARRQPRCRCVLEWLKRAGQPALSADRTRPKCQPCSPRQEVDWTSSMRHLDCHIDPGTRNLLYRWPEPVGSLARPRACALSAGESEAKKEPAAFPERLDHSVFDRHLANPMISVERSFCRRSGDGSSNGSTSKNCPQKPAYQAVRH